MKWRQYWPESLVLLLVLAFQGSKWVNNTTASPLKSHGWTTQRKLAAREKTRDLWYHGFDNYMTYAFPLDELAPLTCTGRGPDWDHPNDISTNDVAGNFSLTLIDVLDTLVVLDDRPGFETAVKNVIEWVSFDVNTRPQVFETTIRVLGGLLSGHIFANQTGQPFFLPWYRGELLDMAHDLGKRLLPAFSTPTGLPYARINLRHGVLKGEGVDTCTAGAGSLLLEFATLSRLTGDERFEKAAYKAFWAIWNRRTDVGLVGNTINVRTGAWTKPEVSGIGAGIDSFHEYALKWYILRFGDVEFLDVWDDTYAAIMRWSRAPDGFWYRPVNMFNGDVAYHTVDSLAAFWPGLQVLAGDVQNAIKLHMIYYNLWRKHSGLPEVYDTHFKQATSFQYPLRPEFIESTWYLYRATGDPFYLDVAERVLSDIIIRAKVPCGLTGIKDLRTNSRDDRMESFALSETLKYLFLIFDEENPLHKDDSNYVFTTEGHLLTLGQQHLKQTPSARRKMRNIENHQCPAYLPLTENNSGLVIGIRSHRDVEYARELLIQPASAGDEAAWSPYGWCERPYVDLFAYDFILSANGKAVPEDLSPSRVKLDVVHDGFIIHNITGVRIHIVQRLDGNGYDIRKLGHYDVRAGHIVYINDSAIFSPTPRDTSQEIIIHDQRPLDLPLRFFIQSTNPLDAPVGLQDLLNMMDISTLGYSALFGPELGVTASGDEPPLRINDQSGVPVYEDPFNIYGCQPYVETLKDAVVLTHRGECTFLEKLLHAKTAGAAGVLVISDEDAALNPTADEADLEAAGDLGDVGLIVLSPETGKLVSEMLASTVERGGQVKLQLTLSLPAEISQEAEKPFDSNVRLHLNGHLLSNTRVLV
ncbi:alpha mannosidase-like protein [Mycena maculata]|uniref:alpha-1,2-Mannosidase n=1 Tax=Mycena maculata TaxID=230809 RepID=A0AAD7IKY3_9AGAR|nr:alpha mannosidase-like protein [Mycena maculata]